MSERTSDELEDALEEVKRIRFEKGVMADELAEYAGLAYESLSMRRARRQTVRRGNLTGKQRRRLDRRMADVSRGWGPGCFARPRRDPASGRDARRLQEAGLCEAVASKCWFGFVKEIELIATREEALRRYPRSAIMRAR